ncbi:hypothetical protein DL96DRAFT_1597253 [Flagelloscypha sp. PMI_526]|nr:hypothetical protein DL96DRAFT_1597253 [Flagelloscypha sp. PMI_526]
MASFLSGALVAGGLYYGFSHLIESRTRQHRGDLGALSARFNSMDIVSTNPDSTPVPAATRIPPTTFRSTLHERWNNTIFSLFNRTRDLDKDAGDFGRRLVYGEGSSSQPNSSESK